MDLEIVFPECNDFDLSFVGFAIPHLYKLFSILANKFIIIVSF